MKNKLRLISNAPLAASSYVSTASGGGLEVIKESMTAGLFMQELAMKAGGSGYGEVVDDLLASIKGMSLQDAKANSHQFLAKDLEGLRTEMKQVVADGAAVAVQFPGGVDYERWILDMAREVAETKTGGFMGIGGKAVIDAQEQAALEELATLLGV